MAIRLITGKPGSGKTYYCIAHLIKSHYKYDTDAGDYFLNDDKMTIISNIDNLKLDHINLDTALKESGKTIEQFFTVDYQKEISKKYPRIIYIIDEAQQYFHRRFYNNDTFYYFQYHRHLGHDIYIVTQSMKLLPVQITELAETELQGQPRTISIVGELKYKKLVNYEVVDRVILKKSKKIFNLYKSQSRDESEKIKSPFLKYAVVLVILVIGSAVLFHFTFLKDIDKHKKVMKDKNNILAKKNPEDYIKSPGQTKNNSPGKTGFVHDNLILVKLNYVVKNNRLLVVDPLLQELIPVAMLKYKVQVLQSSKSLLVLAEVPSWIIDQNEVKSE